MELTKDQIINRIWDHIMEDVDSMSNEYGVIEDQKMDSIYDIVINDLYNTLTSN